MKQMKWICASSILVVCAGTVPAKTEKPDRTAFWAQTSAAPTHQTGQGDPATLDAERERRALEVLLRSMAKEIVSAADAMPADKYGFAPTDGEFKGVRTFGKQVKHLAATNHLLAAAALGEEPPADAGDELGPEAIRTKARLSIICTGRSRILRRRSMPSATRGWQSNLLRFRLYRPIR
jgi:hypothetical protein